jgi:hypothetical protein
MTPAGRQGYSVIRHLAWSVWFNHNRKRCWVTVFAPFTAAYDASGSENDADGTLVVVGLAAIEHKWLRFESSWRTALAEFDVPYLHMKELNHRHSGKGVYAKWKDDYKTPRLFLKKLIKVVKLGINKTFIYGTILKDYRSTNQLYRLREGAGSPYVLTAGSCYDLVNNWMKRNYPRHQIFHAFEAGDCGQRDFKRLAKRHRQIVLPIPKIDPVSGERWIPFQAADLVAGAYREAAGKRGKVQTFDDYGEVLCELARTIPQKALIHHAGTLRDLCENNPHLCPKRL